MITQTEFPLQHTAATTLMFLVESLVTSKLIHFDFEDQAADHGDVVNARIATGWSTAGTAFEKFPAPLTDWNTVSFRLNEKDRGKPFSNLANEYLEPCAIAMANQLDRNCLFWMAVRAGHRLGTPGGGFVMPELGRNKLILSRNASKDLLKSDFVANPLVERERHDALEQATLSTDQIWSDDGCPDVTADLGVLDKELDDISKVYNRSVLGDMNFMFNSASARLACRPLAKAPSSEAVLQEVVWFNGLSLRLTMEAKVDEDTGEPWDKLTCDMLSGVAVNPKETTVIYS